MRGWKSFVKQWDIMTFYQRFESVVALFLTLLITLVVVVAVFRLFAGVINDLVLGAMNPLDHKVFQNVFGEIMTVLIALEFNHTLQYAVTRQQSIIQTKVILLIALLAIARKFIILDLKETTAESMFGLAAITLAIGIVYWLLRERDDRLLQTQALRHPENASTDAET
ncbi:MAG: phosphate-starvation-inducible PsiE family protein [Gammaproteobacteria bacterium]|nr:phosphate-starvation-inducible PsiE family protein [Gammaproteobacteria bacterium]